MKYIPEGSLLHTPENRRAISSIDGLALAMQRRDILEGMVEKCTGGHDLVVRLGDGVGIIPHDETALGAAEGTLKEIAVLSRVGRAAAFTVIGLEADNGALTPILSRRAAQAQVRSAITALPVGSVVSARVTRLEPFGAFVDLGCGLTSMIPIDRISVSRISHPSCRFRPGQDICAVYRGVENETLHLLLSHRELLGTWAENAGRFAPGETVTGVVRGIQSYGVFVELAPNLTGLADRYPGLEEDQRVSVFLKAILPQRQRIKLIIIDAMEERVRFAPVAYFHTSGNFASWRYDG
ncbi:MAG: S1 RNA-binding domain-containing protein [Oscillospiraceae bacterium]|nr:S1 RNA-binding domain-containing protein [Oscillospiraceae bacterium]